MQVDKDLAALCTTLGDIGVELSMQPKLLEQINELNKRLTKQPDKEAHYEG